MKLGSLFDGSGGFLLAGSLCGIVPVWASEIEPFPIRVTTKRFPNVEHLGSVTEIDGGKIEPVDIITFGSPCQDLSVAGKRKGIHDGERSNLFFEAIRVIKEMRNHDRAAGRADVDCRPRYIVWENVYGAYSSNGGDDFRCVLEEICKVADPEVSIPRPDKGKWEPAGCIVGGHYSVAWRTFDAQYWGVPQRRRRIYLVADFAGERAAEILFEQDGLRGNPEESGATREGVAADAERGAGGSGVVRCLNPWDAQGIGQYDPSGVWPALTANTGGGQFRAGVVADALPFDTTQVTSPENGCNPKWGDPCHPLCASAHVPAVVAAFKGGQGASARTIGYDEDVTPTLNASPSGSNQVPDIVYALQANGIDRAETAECNGAGWREDQCYTLNTIDRHAVCYDARDNGDHINRATDYTALCVGNGQMCNITMAPIANSLDCMHDQQAVLTPAHPPRKYIVRRLTPVECARLQGFPDWWCMGLETPEPTEEDIAWAAEVWERWRLITSPNTKPKSRNQLIKWLENPHSDAAEYKLWGNGIALPCAVRVMEGIVKEAHHEPED